MKQLRYVIVLMGVFGAGCNGGSDLPRAPHQPPRQPQPREWSTSSGNLSFGDVAVGSAREATMTVTNTGNAPLRHLSKIK